MTYALWVIAICEMVRVIQNLFQLRISYMDKKETTAIRNAYVKTCDAFEKGLSE